MKSSLKNTTKKKSKRISFSGVDEINTIERVAQLQQAFDELEMAHKKLERIHKKTHQLIEDIGEKKPEDKIKSLVKKFDPKLKRSNRFSGGTRRR